MYFLERAGEGNGSISDNTTSADGNLWKVLIELQAIGQSNVRVPVSDLANGVYLIKVQADGFTATEHLLIQP